MNTICFSFDVEWACDEVIADTCSMLEEHGVRGTFFVTHANVNVGKHERAIHPNFRRDGDIYRILPDAGKASDSEVYRHVVRTALQYAPEAKGVRSHSLLFDSTLLPIYRDCSLEYDASYRLELVAHLRPFMKQHGILEIPTYYADFYDLVTGATRFDVDNLLLGQPGLKVLDFHPNLIYTNAKTEEAYVRSKQFYKDPERLLAARESGAGTRTLLLDLLRYVVKANIPTMTLADLNAEWRGRVERP